MRRLTLSRLKQLMDYDPLTGILRWRVTVGSRAIAGSALRSVDKDGYIAAGVDGHRYPATHLAWLYMTGLWPKKFVDHKNGDVLDNRWANLREATALLNQENRRRASKSNKAGLLGVSPNGDRWAASIFHHYRKHHLGTFDSPRQAHEAYLAAKRRLHEGCTI